MQILTPQLSQIKDDLRLALLYFAQALPMGIAWLGLPPWLRANGISLQMIGLISLCALPWALKFLWAAPIERISQRISCRNLILYTQGLAAVSFILLCLVPFTQQISLGIVLLLVLNTLCATQDIATDRYAILQRGAKGAIRVNVARFTGFTTGMLIGGSGFLFMVPLLGWANFNLVCAAIMAFIGIAVLGMREPILQSSTQTPPISLQQFFKKPFAWRLLSVALLFKASASLSEGMLRSFWVDHGVTLDQISLLTAIIIGVSGLIGAPLCAWVIHRNRNTQNKLVSISTLANIAVLGGICSAFILVLLGVSIYTGIGIVHYQQWHWIYVIFPILQACTDGAASLAFFTLFMYWSVGTQPGTTFTLFLCAESLGSILLASIAGVMAANLGYAVHFIVSALLTIVAMLYALKTIRTYVSRNITNKHQHQELNNEMV